VEGRTTPTSEQDTGAGLRTFLIADVRGYTSFSQREGDEAAARLARRFADIVREGIADHGGELVELRGDEALVVFNSTREALRAAVDMQTRFVAEMRLPDGLPLRVGIGIDAGEAVRVERGYRGRALNLAARLCSIAGPGQVLVSELLVHLAGRVDELRYASRGQVTMKGIDEPIRVLEVQFELELPAEPAVARPARRLPVRALLAGLGALAFAVALGALLLPRATGGGDGVAIGPNTVARIDADSGDVAEVLDGGVDPQQLVSYEGALWVTNGADKTVTRIDLEAQEQRPLGVGTTPTSIAAGAGFVWVLLGLENRLLRIDPATGVQQHTVDVGLNPSDVLVAAGAVWVANEGDDSVWRIDPTALDLRGDPVDVGEGPSGLGVDRGPVWVANALAGQGSLTAIEAETGRVTRPPITLRDPPTRLAVAGDFVWVTHESADRVTQLNADTGDVVRTVNVGNGPQGIAVTAGSVWVANTLDGTLTRIDARSGDPVGSPIDVGGAPHGVTVHEGDVFVAVAER
jgi:class 3 adenylate cyclase/DNA-binding beta-propeller fold protein YncE